jgi:L-arabinonolactonase
MQADLVLDCRNIHGEGVFWNDADQKLWWTDIYDRKLWWFDPVTGESQSIVAPDRVCAFAPRRAGGLLLALAGGLAFSSDGREAEMFHAFEPEKPDTRLNDGRTDRRGRFVVGGMNEGDGAANSSVIRFDPDGLVTTLIRDVAISNSICFSPDGGTLYFTDTPQRRILAYPYDNETGTVGTPRLFADLSDQPGFPDGSCVDAEGGLWNAQWDGHRVVRYAPDGRMDAVVMLPVGKVTCCAFGGAQLDTLYITTSRLGMDDDALQREPLAGGLFAIRTAQRGVIDLPFFG